MVHPAEISLDNNLICCSDIYQNEDFKLRLKLYEAHKDLTWVFSTFLHIWPCNLEMAISEQPQIVLHINSTCNFEICNFNFKVTLRSRIIRHMESYNDLLATLSPIPVKLCRSSSKYII